MRLSGLQKEVLSLYRNCLRASRKKPPESRPNFESFLRSEFSKNIKVDKRDFAAIEFLLRKGRRQLEIMSAPGIKDIKNTLGK
ncbi:complex 1 protein-domain-containing protein [Xylariaceae sp. FL0662B]|nr:complex 1 protein-domain-containing protein [Xylariaceae sp. FL0662B]